MAGEKFLRGVQEGKLLASACSKCGRRFIPPKMYCADCFKETRFREIGLTGKVAALTESHVGFAGERLRSPRLFAYVTFPGVTGGLVQTARGKGLKLGSKVAVRFRAKTKRTGSMLDFEFVKVSG